MERISIRNLPAGTTAALRARTKRRTWPLEAEARDVLTRALEDEAVPEVDLLDTDEGADIEFEPERLGLTARSANCDVPRGYPWCLHCGSEGATSPSRRVHGLDLTLKARSAP